MPVSFTEDISSDFDAIVVDGVSGKVGVWVETTLFDQAGDPFAVVQVSDIHGLAIPDTSKIPGHEHAVLGWVHAVVDLEDRVPGNFAWHFVVSWECGLVCLLPYGGFELYTPDSSIEGEEEASPLSARVRVG